MHPVAFAALSGMGLMVGGVLMFVALGLHEMRCQEEAYRQSSYYAEGEERRRGQSFPSRRSGRAATATTDEDELLLDRILHEATAELQALRQMAPGDSRRRAVRHLKLRYHPDKYPGSLREVMTKVSCFINLQTQHMR